jgi:hypothetical protein
MTALPLAGLVLAGCAKTGEDTGSGATGCETGVEVGECPLPFTLPDRSGAEVPFADFMDRIVAVSLFTGW